MNDEIKYTLGGLFFTWDDNKAVQNWKKHRVDFRLAAEVYLDEHAVDVFDFVHSDMELRRKVIGSTVGRRNTLFVVYVEREDCEGVELYRLISARNATGKEKKTYEHELSR